MSVGLRFMRWMDLYATGIAKIDYQHETLTDLLNALNEAHRAGKPRDVLLFRLDQQAISLSQGVRRYQNPAIADLLDSILGSLSSGLEWLRSQSLEMAQQREKELDVAQKEAQRCRTQILQPRPRN